MNIFSIFKLLLTNDDSRASSIPDYAASTKVDRADDTSEDDKSRSGEDSTGKPKSVADFIRLQSYNFTNILPSVFSTNMVRDQEVDALNKERILSVTEIQEEFPAFSFCPRHLSEKDEILSIISMMNDMKMLSRWCIQKETLIKFMLMVRRGYRNNPFHNWKHAFSVGHFAYLLVMNLDLTVTAGFSDLETFALFISSLCHDLDHRGTSNSFQVTYKSVLSTLYSTEGSMLEMHHLSQAIGILNTEGCNILDNLTHSEYNDYINLMKTIILATDVAHHFRILPELQEMAEYTFNPEDPVHHHLVTCLLITSCDLSDQTKDWPCAVSAAALIYKEFFNQGDLEKAMNMTPIEMMDREKASVPESQFKFIDKVASPVYKILGRIFPNASEPHHRILRNKKRWRALDKVYSEAIENHEIELNCDIEDIVATMGFGLENITT